MSPARAVEDEGGIVLLHLESTAIEMTLWEGTAYLELLTYDACGFGAHYLEAHDAPWGTTLDGDEVEDVAIVKATAATHEIGQLVLGILYRPAVEVGRLVIVVEHLGEYLRIVGTEEASALADKVRNALKGLVREELETGTPIEVLEYVILSTVHTEILAQKLRIRLGKDIIEEDKRGE